jgi:hypothetical protein
MRSVMQNQNTMTTQITYLHNNFDRFHIFDNFISKFDKHWTDGYILDIGGNCGSLLKSSSGKIKNHQYSILDCNKGALLRAKQEYPDITIYHYDYFNNSYNKQGSKNLVFPEFKNKFQTIILSSVLCHFYFQEIDEYLLKLQNHLQYECNIVFTLFGWKYLYLLVNNYWKLFDPLWNFQKLLKEASTLNEYYDFDCLLLSC